MISRRAFRYCLTLWSVRLEVLFSFDRRECLKAPENSNPIYFCERTHRVVCGLGATFFLKYRQATLARKHLCSRLPSTMPLFRGLLRSGRTSFQLSILSASSIALILLYASGEHSALHTHVLDDYHDNVRLIIDRTKSFNPFSFALGGPPDRTVGGWHVEPNGKLSIPVDEEGNIISGSEPRRHPFHALMDQAEERWNNVRSRYCDLVLQTCNSF